MKSPLLATKLNIPTVPLGMIERTKSAQKLASVEHLSLGLVVAPAGFGKTSLTAAWLRHIKAAGGAEVSCGWLSLEPADNALVRFFTYFFRLLNSISSCPGVSSIDLEAPQEFWNKEINTLLANDLNCFCQPTFLVLDNYQVITNPQIHESLSFLLNNPPPQFHLVICSREEPPFPLHLLRARRQIVEINRSDLSFSEMETARFLRETFDLNLSDEEVRLQRNRSEGWVTGLQLSALSLQARLQEGEGPGPKTIIEPDHMNRFTVDYLSKEVFLNLRPETQMFLSQISILERFTPALCDEVCQIDTSKALLEKLERENLFIIPLDHGRNWFRFHALMAEFLQTRLDAPTQKMLHQRAARWLQAQGLMIEAISHLLAAEDFDCAAKLIEDVEPQVLLQNEFFRLAEKWLTKIPQHMLIQYSMLAYLKIFILYYQAQRDLAEKLLACLPIETTKTSLTKRLVLSELACSLGEPEKALALLQADIKNMTGIELSGSLEVYSEGLRLIGQKKEATNSFRKSFHLANKYKKGLLAGMSLWHLAQLMVEAGEREESEAICQQFMQEHLFPDGQMDPVVGLAQVCMGIIHYEANKLDASMQYLQQGIANCRKIGLYKQTLAAERCLARCWYIQGERQKAYTGLVSAGFLAKEIGHTEEIQLMAAAKAQLEIRMGNLPATEDWAREFSAQAASVNGRINPQVYLVYIQYLLVMNQLKEAGDLCLALDAAALQQGQHFYRMVAHILQAVNCQYQDDLSGTIHNLKIAIRLAAPQNYRRIFLDFGPGLRSFLPSLCDFSPDFVSQLIADFSVMPGRAPFILAGGPRSLFSDREWEILTLVSDGMSNQKISEQLYLSVGTIKWYLNEIYKKLGVHDRQEAMAYFKYFSKDLTSTQL